MNLNMRIFKSILITTVITFSLLIFGSCSNINELELSIDTIGTRSSVPSYSSNNVTYNDIQSLLTRKSKTALRSSNEKHQIYCIPNNSGDTLLYICNKNSGGWTIYATDKRVPSIVGDSNEGSIEELLQNEAAMMWIKSLAQDMENIKRSDDSDLKFSLREIEDNKTFWESISKPNDFINNNLYSQNYVMIDTTKIHPIIPNGHYEYLSSSSYFEIYDSIPRLTTTDWHQHPPFNKYCPFTSFNIGRAPAGCVAISCAQMMYFLHHNYGIPLTAPSEAYCNGNVNSQDYDWAQTNYTIGIWNQMTYNEEAAAPLIADIGRRVNMKYGDNGSAANTKDLVNNVFTPYGISSVFTSYDPEILKSNLTNGLPVIISAYSSDKQTLNDGHSFLIDRYRRSREVVISVYRWVYDFIPKDTPIPYVPDKVVYTYQSPYIDMVGMNWGWKNTNNNYGWFALTGDWYMNNGEQFNFNINRGMLYINPASLPQK